MAYCDCVHLIYLEMVNNAEPDLIQSGWPPCKKRNKRLARIIYYIVFLSRTLNTDIASVYQQIKLVPKRLKYNIYTTVNKFSLLCFSGLLWSLMFALKKKITCGKWKNDYRINDTIRNGKASGTSLLTWVAVK